MSSCCSLNIPSHRRCSANAIRFDSKVRFSDLVKVCNRIKRKSDRQFPFVQTSFFTFVVLLFRQCKGSIIKCSTFHLISSCVINVSLLCVDRRAPRLVNSFIPSGSSSRNRWMERTWSRFSQNSAHEFTVRCLNIYNSFNTLQ